MMTSSSASVTLVYTGTIILLIIAKASHARHRQRVEEEAERSPINGGYNTIPCAAKDPLGKAHTNGIRVINNAKRQPKQP